ncbi:hypothetical protein MMC32_005964 [Xylographa parallela]|nr:hypothetical protein [Xylographa parallela]
MSSLLTTAMIAIVFDALGGALYLMWIAKSQHGTLAGQRRGSSQEHRPDNIRARCANETEPPYPYSGKPHHPTHQPSGSLSGFPASSSAGAFAPSGPSTGIYPVSTLASTSSLSFTFPSAPIYTFSFPIPSGTGGPRSATAPGPTDPASSIVLSTYTPSSSGGPLPIYNATLLSYHHSKKHHTKNQTSGKSGPTAYSGVSLTVPTGGYGSSGGGPLSYSSYPTAPYLNSSAGLTFIATTSTPSFYSSGSYIYTSVPVSSNNGALPASSPVSNPNTTTIGLFSTTSSITYAFPTAASSGTGGPLPYSGSPPLYTNTSTTAVPSLTSFGTAPVSSSGGAIPASLTGTSTYNTTVIYSTITETVIPTPPSYSSLGTASSGFAPSSANFSFSYTISIPSVSSNDGGLSVTSPPLSSFTFPVFNTSILGPTFVTSAPGIPSYPLYTYTPPSSSSTTTSTDTCTDDPSSVNTTSVPSAPAPYSFTTITKSMPSEYFYHHHHPPHKTHKPKPYGWGPFH